RIEHDGLSKVAFCVGKRGSYACRHSLLAELVRLPRFEIFCGDRYDAGLLSRGQCGLESTGDGPGDLALDVEDIGRRQFPVVIFRPEVRIGARVDELYIDAHTVAAPLY